jgi:hypothetical protein
MEQPSAISHQLEASDYQEWFLTKISQVDFADG